MSAKRPKTVTASLGLEPGSLATDLSVRHHRFAADEAPPRYDSTDAHPDPYDYILAGVAACTVISIRLSAEAKGYPLERAEVAVTFERCPPREPGGQPDRITRTITLHGEGLNELQRLKLVRAANCAAYKSITSGIPITTIAEEPAAEPELEPASEALIMKGSFGTAVGAAMLGFEQALRDAPPPQIQVAEHTPDLRASSGEDGLIIEFPAGSDDSDG